MRDIPGPFKYLSTFAHVEQLMSLLVSMFSTTFQDLSLQSFICSKKTCLIPLITCFFSRIYFNI